MKLDDVFRLHEQGQLDVSLPPYMIAEAGVNHEGDIDIAKRQVELAAGAGFDAIKFQTYKADTIACKDSPFYWNIENEPTRSQYELFKKYDKFGCKEYQALKAHCDAHGIEFLSTPFDVDAVDFLADMMPAIKVSSSDLNNLPFIDHICSKKKPVLLSTGSANMWEVHRTVAFILARGVKVALLHCVLNYPTEDRNANLGMILDLKKQFPDLIVGYSDHTLPKDMSTLVTAATLGSSIIEKHFTHDKNLPGNDHYHSMDVHDMTTFKAKLERVLTCIGSTKKAVLPSEVKSRANARRSLVSNCDIPASTVLTKDHVTWKRPGTGIPVDSFYEVIGRRTLVDVGPDTVLQWRMLSDD
jgi:N-acetylneuraminate synthase